VRRRFLQHGQAQFDAIVCVQRLKMNMRGGFGGGKSGDWSRRI
jgi:hypothetical protein